MAQSQTGKWVSRVGSTGGGRNYRSRRPLNFYGIITIIVVLGTASVLFARHEYRTTPVNAATLPPVIGTTQFAALGFDVCGTIEPSLAGANNASTAELGLMDSGVVRVSPTTAAFAGKNANVSKLADTYAGLVISTSELRLPYASPGKVITLKNGDACPAGTPDAGKTGYIAVSYWSSFAAKSSVTALDPAVVRFTANSLVTVAFIPSGKTVQKPSQTSINKMLIASQSGSTTPTTAPATTIPVTTTTAPATTTTAKK